MDDPITFVIIAKYQGNSSHSMDEFQTLLDN